MTAASDIPRVAIQLTEGCLIATIQIELGETVLRQFQRDLLDRIRDTGARGIVLDLSGVRVIDAQDFEMLRRTTAMASIMGARSILAGMRAGVVSSLVEVDTDLDGLETCLNLDDALERLRPSEPVPGVGELEPVEDPEELPDEEDGDAPPDQG